MSSSGEFTILYRLKSNQRNPVKIRVDTTLVKDDYLSLDNLYTILNKEFQDLEVSTAKIRYLQNMKYYVDLPREGVPFDANRTAELYICLPPNKVYHTNTDGSLKKNPTGVQFEAAFSQKLDVMERTIQSMESKLIKIAEKIGFRTHLRDSSQGVPASSNNSQNLHMGVFRSQNGEEESQTGEMIEEDKDKLATPTPASTGDISSFRLNLTKAVSAQPFMPELSFSLRHNMSVNVGSSSSTSRARSEFFSPHQRLQTNLFNPRDTFVLHLAILYSNPMVEIVEKKNRVQCAMLTGDPVDFNGECASILHCLESHKKKLSVHIECANCDQFIQIVKEKPLVIHIMCHGDFDPDKGEYFLEFENHKAELLRLYPSKLKELLTGTNLSDIRLVFINACHSEAIGRAFLELGVRSVIVASSEHKLNDEFAKVFSKLFYDELLEGKTIGEAFENARVQLKAVNLDASDSCCCGHEHEPNCQWYAEYKQQGRYLAHAAHECLCSCPARMYHIHDPDCYWAEDFMMKYDVMPPEEDGREIYLCCCRPHLTHDETMKLQLLYKEDKKVDIEVFSNLDSGKVNQVRKVFFGENKFQDCVTVGKNRTIYQIFNSFTYENVRLIYLVGESGSGKSMLSKHIANYMTERRKVDNTYYLNMDKVSNVAVVLARIPDYRQITSFDYKTNSAGQELLVILDNMDTILTNHYKAFRTALQELLEQTKLKFLIVATNSNWAANSGSQWQEKIVQVPPLNTQAAAKLLKMMANDYLPSSLRNVVNLQSHPIFKASEGFTLKATPKVISDIAFLLKKGNKTLDKIYEDYCLREGEKGKAVKIEDQSLKERKEFIE
jgi:energy-coupling factor transporter ATP-binding protein EcfA2